MGSLAQLASAFRKPSTDIASALVEALAQAGVKRIYGIVGDSLNAITEVLRKQDAIQWISVRHEEIAAFAAGAEAHLTGSLVVCAGSCGPGNLHLINGLFDCHRSRVPVLAIAAQIPSAEIGSEYFQETHPERLFRDCSSFCESIASSSQATRLIRLAIQSAIGGRGVSVLVLPGDVAMEELEGKGDAAQQALAPPAGRSRSLPCPAEIQRLASLLNQGKKITILGGIGCAEAHGEVVALADKLKAPVVHSLRGKEFLEHDNPFDIGMSGLLGMHAGYHALKDCDTLLMLGTDFPYRQFYPQHARIAQVDARAEAIGRRVSVEQGLVGDVKATLEALLPRITARKDDRHLKQALERHAQDRQALVRAAQPGDAEGALHPQHLTSMIDELAADDAIFTCDVGTPTVWAARFLKMNGKRRLIGSFNHGSMASALAQAIGAQCAFPDRQVIALCGDGGLSMSLGDILTLRQHALPIKIVVYDNDAYAFVDLEMKVAGLIPTQTRLDNPSFAALARAVGLVGQSVDVTRELDAELPRFLGEKGPALLDVRVRRNEVAWPPEIEASQATGFGLYAAKAVLSGQGDELLDLAKTSLFR